MTDIVAFLEARWAEVEEHARKADWRPGKPWRTEYPHGHRGGSGIVWNSTGQSIMSNPHEPTCEHVAAWQPEHVLAHIAAWRRIVERYKKTLEQPISGLSADRFNVAQYVVLGEVLIDLAAPYRDHPDWDPEWEVEGR
jgi:hypothetical protein